MSRRWGGRTRAFSQTKTPGGGSPDLVLQSGVDGAWQCQWGLFDYSWGLYIHAMAECQAPYPYDASRIDALKASLSEPRFATYLTKADGNEPYAFALYLYNLKLAESFLFPLGVVEITMRNVVDDVLVQEYGVAWHRDTEFCNNVGITPLSDQAQHLVLISSRNSDQNTIYGLWLLKLVILKRGGERAGFDLKCVRDRRSTLHPAPRAVEDCHGKPAGAGEC